MKMHVHNIGEVRALIKEAYAHGNEIIFDGTVWLNHEYKEICTSIIDSTGFILILDDEPLYMQNMNSIQRDK